MCQCLLLWRVSILRRWGSNLFCIWELRNVTTVICLLYNLYPLFVLQGLHHLHQELQCHMLWDQCRQVYIKVKLCSSAITSCYCFSRVITNKKSSCIYSICKLTCGLVFGARAVIPERPLVVIHLTCAYCNFEGCSCHC